MKLLTANRLTDGAVLWLAGRNMWTEDFDNAAVLDAATADGALAIAQDEPGLLIAPYLVEVDDDGVDRRERLREAIRAKGPSVGHSVKAPR